MGRSPQRMPPPLPYRKGSSSQAFALAKWPLPIKPRCALSGDGCADFSRSTCGVFCLGQKENARGEKEEGRIESHKPCQLHPSVMPASASVLAAGKPQARKTTPFLAPPSCVLLWALWCANIDASG